MYLSNKRSANDRYPLYFLASLGAGGLAVTFSMLLIIWVPNPDQTVLVFEDFAGAFFENRLPLKIINLLTVNGIAGFVFLNVMLLIWNLVQLSQFRKSVGSVALTVSNGETQLMAMALALAISANTGFIVCLMFIPNSWSVVENLFPLAAIAFGLIVFQAFRRIGRFMEQFRSDGGVFKVTALSSYSWLLPAFALSMTAVGVSTLAAIGTIPLMVRLSLVLCTIAALYAPVAAIVAFNSILRHGELANTDFVISILTLLGIFWTNKGLVAYGVIDRFGPAFWSLTSLALVVKVSMILLVVNPKRRHFGQQFNESTVPAQ